MSTAAAVHIRAVTPADEERLAEFLIANDRPEVTRTFRPFPMDAASAERIARRPGRDRYFIALDEGRIAGLGMLRGWNEGYEVPSFGVVVDHRKQGRGVGRALAIAAIEEARSLSCSRVRLTVYASNGRAARLYESLGYTETSRDAVEVNGQADEKVVMVKEITPRWEISSSL